MLEIAIVRDFLRPLTYVSGLPQAGQEEKDLVNDDRDVTTSPCISQVPLRKAYEPSPVDSVSQIWILLNISETIRVIALL